LRTLRLGLLVELTQKERRLMREALQLEVQVALQQRTDGVQK
jgi:hypothetical protein